jgi:hypothetical protein
VLGDVRYEIGDSDDLVLPDRDHETRIEAIVARFGFFGNYMNTKTDHLGKMSKITNAGSFPIRRGV